MLNDHVCGARANGEECELSAECQPSSECVSGVCTSKGTSEAEAPEGRRCLTPGDCVFGHYCISPNGFAEDMNSYCIPARSLANGQWCNYTNGVCASGVCDEQGLCRRPRQKCDAESGCDEGFICACPKDADASDTDGLCIRDPCHRILLVRAPMGLGPSHMDPRPGQLSRGGEGDGPGAGEGQRAKEGRR